MRSSLARRTLGPFFVFAGLMHFIRREHYEVIVPDYLPAHRELVLASGAAEMLGGAAAIGSRLRFARWWLTATLLAVYPANVHMALHPERYSRIPRWALYARLPVQGPFLLWVWRGTARLIQGVRGSTRAGAVLAVALLAVGVASGCGSDDGRSHDVDIVGEWRGRLEQQGLRPFEVQATIRSFRKSAENPVHYTGIGCSGNWTLLSQGVNDYRFRERLSHKPKPGLWEPISGWVNNPPNAALICPAPVLPGAVPAGPVST